MAGYLYCMRNTHPRYRGFLKIGYTERLPDDRLRELSTKWRCSFELLWDLPVYDAKAAEYYLHNYLREHRVDYEFFRIAPEKALEVAEKLLDENWREIEGKEILPPSIAELADMAAEGIILEPAEEQPYMPDLGIFPDYGPDSDSD